MSSSIMVKALAKEWKEIKERNRHICLFPEDVFKETDLDDESLKKPDPHPRIEMKKASESEK